MKNFIFIVLLCLISIPLFAQNTSLEGIVTDSLNNPVELANVMAFYQKDSSVASFGITDRAGRYRLIVPQGEAYTLKSSFVGYKTFELIINVQEAKISQNIMLMPSATMLNDVEVRYEFPITISGDTIIYKTDEFTTGTERKLGDVLEALPGFEIDDNGDIKVQGKRVDKVLVDGKEFFDGNSKMATENIPADAVDRIQLLRNYSDISPLRGLSNDQSLAINVTLAADKKNLWFGDVEVAGGPDQRYLAHPNLFYYSPKTNVNIIGDANNIGKQAFTLQDYFRFSGGIRRIGSRSGSSINISSDELGISLMQNMMAKNIESNLGAINLNYQPSKKWRFSAYGIASGIETTTSNISNRTYVRSQENTVENTTSSLIQQNTSGLLKLSSAYTPSHKVHLEYGAFLKASSITETDNRSSDFGVSTNNLTELDEKRPVSVDQNLLGYFTINPNNIFSVETSWSYKKQVPKYQLNTGVIPLQGILPLTLGSTFNIRQNNQIITNALKGEANYYYILNNTNHINFSLGFTRSQQAFDSKIIQVLENVQDASLDNGDFDNDVSYRFQDYYAGVHYKTKLGKLTLSPGLIWHAYNISDTQLNTKNTLTKQLVTPDLFAKYDFGSSHNLTFNYSLNAQFTDVQNVAERGVIRNYNSWFVGNRNIENVLFHQVNMNYFNYNMFNHVNLYFSINYQKKYNDIIEAISYNVTDRITSPQNIPIWNDQLSSNFSFEKKFVNLKLKASSEIMYRKFQNEVEQVQNNNSALTQEYNLSAESKFSNAPNFEIGFKKSWNTYTTNTISQVYTTNSPFIELEVPFLKSFTLIAEYEYNNYQNKDHTTVSNYDFMKAELYYEKEDSPWVFKLSVNNLLQTSEIRRDNFNDNVVSTFSYEVLPRYVMMSVKYNL
ncbi:MAG: hypothetical protein ACI9P5_004376 [Saprospiraceae bacterium]|jgi:hypothetical protein